MWNVSSILEGLEHEQRVNADLRGKSVFNLCVIFLWIFLCIYVLPKLTQLVELFLCQRLLGQKQWYDVRTIKSEWEQTLQLYEDDKSQLDAQKPRPAEPNIYITNSHFHLTRQMFLNESQINLNVHDAGEKGASGEGKNVWLQYLRMRKCYMSPIADPNFVDPSTTKQILPIVMSTEQLAEMQGMI
ncbi:uncharacterized protein LOC117137305 isoform X2 [Drosophila mauritiana]|uniref:Uncharacterized protein LOC117137305 isoform X2 n=1 Tax=Drosophila mauritiana TaxID=7226 RepID=A0A6P8JVY4_DROMA|nr:uncharacterized protein LOC117137305 isoform X2 [Drosophila mauritiana]